MGVRGRSPDETTETSSRIREALADAHEEWSVEVEEVSGRIVIEAEREQFHSNSSSAGALALDHPKKAGWEVLAPGNRDVRWREMYDSGDEAATALAEITNIFEARRSIKHERPSDWTVRAYYKIETLLLDSLKDDHRRLTTNRTPSTAMSTKPKDAVWISRETAETALTELNNLLDYADAKMEIGGMEAAMDDLWHALEDEELRTSVTSSGEFDKLAIAGVSDEAVVIDYGRTPPRAVITTDGGEVPTDIIELPADDEDGTDANDSDPETVAVDAPDNGGEG